MAANQAIMLLVHRHVQRAQALVKLVREPRALHVIHVIQGPILKEVNVFHLVVRDIMLILLHFFVRRVLRIVVPVLQIRPVRPVLRDIG